jgi:hypothetical protein
LVVGGIGLIIAVVSEAEACIVLKGSQGIVVEDDQVDKLLFGFRNSVDGLILMSQSSFSILGGL